MLLSHPTMGAWIEIATNLSGTASATSHPTMGAWIEIETKRRNRRNDIVAPHDGCVD